MASEEEVRQVLGNVLQLGERVKRLESDTALLGNIPEFDSMAVVSLVTALEEQFGIVVDDEDLSASVFETLDSLVEFVNARV